MSGLLLKELLLLKSGWKLYAFMAVIFAAVSFMGNSAYFSSMMVMFLLLLPVSSFTSDELARWDKFAAALPGGRRAAVKAKYQFLFLVVGATFAVSCVVNLLVLLFGRADGLSYSELVLTALVSVLAGLLLNEILYPFLFKFGSQKARLLLGAVFGVVVAVFGVSMIFLSVGGSTPLDLLEELPPTISPVVPAAAVVLLILAVVISYRVSCRIYEKKEF